MQSTWSTTPSQLASSPFDVNKSPEEAQQSASALLDNIILQSRYQDDLSSYADEDIKQAMLNEFQQLQQHNVGTPVINNNVTDKQRHSIIDTRWAKDFCCQRQQGFPKGSVFLENYRHGGRFWGSIFLREDFSILVHT